MLHCGEYSSIKEEYKTETGRTGVSSQPGMRQHSILAVFLFITSRDVPVMWAQSPGGNADLQNTRKESVHRVSNDATADVL